MIFCLLLVKDLNWINLHWTFKGIWFEWWVRLIVQLLLGYLPPDRCLWSTELAKKRSQYKHFKDELLMNPVSLVEDFISISILFSFSVGYKLLNNKL